MKEYYHDGAKSGQKTVEEFYKDLINFTGQLRIKMLITDNAPIASSFNIHVRRHGKFICKNADNTVAEGIQRVATALSTGTLKINDCCKNTIREFGLYSWNTKSVEDEPIKENAIQWIVYGISYKQN